MLRFLQTQNDKPLEVLKAGAALKRGAFVYKDGADDELKVLASGLGDDIVDISNNYDGDNAIFNPNDGSFETIAENAQALRVPTMVGERYASSEITRNYADAGDPMNVSAGKLVKAAGASAYQWVYSYPYTDSTGIALHAVEKVSPSTAPATRTMTYNANTGTGTMTDPRSPYFVGKKAVALENSFVAPTYYTFGKWDTAANGSGSDVVPGAELTIADANITLYAQWVATYSGIVYNANGGTGETVDSNLYEEDDVATVLDNEFTPPSGRLFSKWNTAADGAGTDFDPEGEITILEANIGTPITLYAIWIDDETTFRVEFDANGGAGTTVDPDSPYELNADVTLVDSTFTPPEGFGFAGWNTTAEGVEGTGYLAGATIDNIAADVLLYARYAPLFTLTYDSNGGSGSMIDPDSPYLATSTAIVLANAFTPPEGKTFVKWNLSADGSGIDYAPAAELPIGINLTLYAIWA